MQVIIRYSPNPKAVGLIYQTFGTNYEQTYIIPELRFFSRSILANYSSTELHRQDKSIITEAIIDSLATDFEGTNYFNYYNLEISKIEYPHLIKQAKQEGLIEPYELLKSTNKAERIEGIEQLLNNGSKTAYLIILTHWTNEKDQEVLDFIIERLAKD